MPKKGARLRAETIAHLSELLHDRFIHLNDDGVVTSLKAALETGKLNDQDSVIIRETWREYRREKKLPAQFVKELAQITSEANTVWANARAQSDFSLYLPFLQKIIDLKKQEAEYVGYTDTPYDALLDTYEPYTTTREIAAVLEEVKHFLVPYLQKIKQSHTTFDTNKLKGDFAYEKQIALIPWWLKLLATTLMPAVSM